jgi:hypothetical protein
VPDLNFDKQVLQDMTQKKLQSPYNIGTQPNTSSTLTAFRPAKPAELLVCSTQASYTKHTDWKTAYYAIICKAIAQVRIHYGNQ